MDLCFVFGSTLGSLYHQIGEQILRSCGSLDNFNIGWIIAGTLKIISLSCLSSLSITRMIPTSCVYEGISKIFITFFRVAYRALGVTEFVMSRAFIGMMSLAWYPEGHPVSKFRILGCKSEDVAVVVWTLFLNSSLIGKLT